MHTYHQGGGCDAGRWRGLRVAVPGQDQLGDAGLDTLAGGLIFYNRSLGASLPTPQFVDDHFLARTCRWVLCGDGRGLYLHLFHLDLGAAAAAAAAVLRWGLGRGARWWHCCLFCLLLLLLRLLLLGVLRVFVWRGWGEGERRLLVVDRALDNNRGSHLSFFCLLLWDVTV